MSSLLGLQDYGGSSDSNDDMEEENFDHLKPVDSSTSVIKDLVKVEAAPLVNHVVSTT